MQRVGSDRCGRTEHVSKDPERKRVGRRRVAQTRQLVGAISLQASDATASTYRRYRLPRPCWPGYPSAAALQPEDSADRARNLRVRPLARVSETGAAAVLSQYPCPLHDNLRSSTVGLIAVTFSRPWVDTTRLDS